MDWKKNMNVSPLFKASPLLSKTEAIIGQISRALNKALMVAWIMTGSMSPVAVSLWTAAGLFAACSSDNAAEELKDVTPPTITLKKASMEVAKGKTIAINGKMLHIGNDLLASWSDDRSETCQVTLMLNWKPITSWTILNDDGTLTLTVSDEAGNASKVDVKLSIEPSISWLEKLQKSAMQVDKEIDLLKWLTFAEGVTLVKTEIEIDGETTTISDVHHYTPEYPWECNLIITIQDKDGNSTKHHVDHINIAPLEYKAITIKNLKPADILPIVNKVELWDKQCYNHIEHLRLAEATRIRDMMWNYGAGNHSPEQYQQLMMRLNTGMLGEVPLWYNNYWTIGVDIWDEWSEHAHEEWNILNSLLSHTNLKVVFSTNRRKNIETFIKENNNSISIFWCSAYPQVDKDYFDVRPENNKVRELCKSGKLIIFKSGWNIYKQYWILKNKSYHRDVDWDEHWIYSLQANANWINDTNSDIALLVTVWTNKNGKINQTNEIVESSLFPVWFHNKSLFAWRAFPFHSSISWKIEAEWSINGWKYATSFTNYVNVAMTGLCFQMFAEAKDVNQLLEMIRSTCLTDYIRFDLNGDGDTNDTYKGQPETQPLQLINPAWFFQKYLMPTSLPASVKASDTVSLNKGYYKGVIFDIPGAEVKVDGKWIAYSDANKALILAQNPFKVEWRLNGDLCKKMGYGSEKTLKGKVIVVDDKFNGLNITKEFSVTLSP